MKTVPILLVVVLLLSFSALAQDIGTVTLLDQKLRIIRGTTVLQGAEGVRLRQGDIIETAEAGFAQLEFRGGTIVALGPSSRLFLFRHGSNGAELVLLSGWLKGESSASTSRYDSPLLSVSTVNGAVLLHVDSGGAEIFIESGTPEIDEVSHDGNLSHPTRAKAGQFFTRRVGKDVAVTARPSPGFLQGMPIPFRDTLPSRVARFAAKAVEPKRDHEVSYIEAQPWLTMGRTWRRDFVERFQSRLKDPEFRQGLEDHLSSHEEWEPILHPENHKTDNPQTYLSDPSSQHLG
jgi:hypothetical protein